MCGIILCGIKPREKTLSTTPEDYPEAPSNVICTFCTFKGNAAYKRRDTWFTLFFIPICPIKFGDPYVACISCDSMLGKYGANFCKYCRTVAPLGYNFCTRCGKNLTPIKPAEKLE